MRAFVFFMLAVSASAASAAEKLVVGAPPPWVKPVALPTNDKPDGTPVKIVLLDQQVDLQPGRMTTYGESAMRIQTPEGLSASAISFSWDPVIESVTVHKLLIHRGTQIIDVLAGGQSFTVVRREPNLEYAVLDGRLTATLQPEGVQVGDVVDLAVSVTRSDPALGSHVEHLLATWNGVAISRAHLRAQWPSTVPMRLRAAGDLALPKVAARGGLSSIELAQDDIQPLVLPKDAPGRYQRGRRLELTDFTAWSDLSRLFAPLYVKAAKLAPASPLRGEIARIAASSSDPVARAEAVLALVQNRVRYVALLLNNGGLIPTDADVTWSRRFGDCKGKTVLLLAMLHELGIKAEPVIVGQVGDGLDQRLPMVSPFDHVIAWASIGGRDYWLDGTRQGDTHLAGIETPQFYWGLPLTDAGAPLVSMMPPPRTQPDTELTVRIDASKGITLPAAIHVERLIRGDGAIDSNLAINSKTGAARDLYLRDYFKDQYDSLEVKIAAASFDAEKRELLLTMDGAIAMDWTEGWYRVDVASVGYKADFRRDPGPDRDAPYQTGYPSYFHVNETILLPPKAGAFALYEQSTNVDQTIAGVAYKRSMKLDGSRFTVDESERAVTPEFPASDAPSAQVKLRELDNRPVLLRRPLAYNATPEEIAALRDKPPVTGEDYRRRGAAFVADKKYPEALADFTKAIELDPKNTDALGTRAMFYVLTGKFALADADADAALAINPRHIFALRAKGAIAEKNGDSDGLIAAANALLANDPTSSANALAMRAEGEGQKHQDAAALADADAALKLNSQFGGLYLLRANIYRRRGDDVAAQRQAELAIAAMPNDTYVLIAAGKIYAAYKRQADAMAAFDKALKLEPDASVYLNRGESRDWNDIAGRQADIDAALKLKPNLLEAWYDQIGLFLRQKKWTAALQAVNKAMALEPPSVKGYLTRASVYQKLRDPDHSLADFAAARSIAKTADQLNAVCWTKATVGVVLDSALADCDAALAQSPNNAEALDSRAFVLMRLRRDDEAIAAYGKALAVRPRLATSLFGRAVAEAHKGDLAASERDITDAVAISPRVREEFQNYGISIDGTAIAPAAKASAPSPPQPAS